jgi:broad specificity phosphatase PhoE
VHGVLYLNFLLSSVPPDCLFTTLRDTKHSAEQQFGNFQTLSIQDNKATRSDYGRFFYRFPDGGESGFDVYNRVSGFIGTMQRDSYNVLERWSKNCPKSLDEGMTICIVTHGLALRLFLMRWFQYTVHEFERSYNPKNGRVVVLTPAESGGFELSEVDRIAMGFPLHKEQERFRLMDDHSLLDKSEW